MVDLFVDQYIMYVYGTFKLIFDCFAYELHHPYRSLEEERLSPDFELINNLQGGIFFWNGLEVEELIDVLMIRATIIDKTIQSEVLPLFQSTLSAFQRIRKN
jgi:hypothetical protein